MKRLIATFGVATALALTIAGYAGASAFPLEAELRNGADDPIATPTATASPTATADDSASPTAAPTANTTATPAATAKPAASVRPTATASPSATGTPELRHGNDDPPGDDRGRRGRG